MLAIFSCPLAPPAWQADIYKYLKDAFRQLINYLEVVLD